MDIRIGVGFAALALQAASSADTPPPHRVVPYALHSGTHAGSSDSERLAFETTVIVPGGDWLRLRFGEAALGRHSYLALSSAADGGYQVLDATALEEWDLASAYFNGEAVHLQLWVAPGDAGVFVELFDVLVGEGGGGEESLCGQDNRVPSTDNRVGRLTVSGCTAWRVTNGAILTAGHCTDFDPDDCGPLLPDGIHDMAGCIEFNVPDSQGTGMWNFALPEDQYPVDTTYVAWRFDGECQGLGKDWAVIGVARNSNTGLLPHEAYGFPFRVSNANPPVGATIRITGFGADTGTSNQTNQTSTGPFLGESASGFDIWQEYTVDTRPGNSGSPVIYEALGIAIGIHTNGGCDLANDQGNFGTSFEVNQLEQFLAGFSGSNVRFVDVGHPLSTQNGSIFQPYATLAQAVATVSTGGKISMVAGTYSEAAGNAITIDKPLTIVSPTGSAVIGL